MSGNTESSGLKRRLDARTPSGLSTFRLLAILSGAGLLWSFLSVFYELADVGGDVDPFLTVTVLTVVAGTVAARFVPVRIGLVVGVIVLGGGIGAYLTLVPEVLVGTASAELVAELGVYLTGLTVLNFLRIDLWAVAVAPAPTFACWYFLLRRRYGLAALAGGLALGFFTLTTDAGAETTLIGSLSLLGMLAFGGLERADGTWHQVERAALVGLLGLLGARMVAASGNAAVSLPGGDDNQPTLESTLLDNDDSVGILGSIELSPEVRFTVEADEGIYWRVGAHDRYTGDAWLRTGASRQYEGTLPRPVGPDRRIVQEYEIRDDSLSLPAAWKPTDIDGVTTPLRLTSLRGFKPAPSETIEAGTEYTVTSYAPTASVDELRRAGDDYPEELSEEYVRTPDSTPDRVGELAADIADGADTPYEVVSAIERWLEANKGYSLDISRPSGDIVDGFLFSMSEGYCVYFATAMAVMLRTLGVPARFVTGYTTGQQVDSGEWLVRGLNSHAWVEVYFPDIGWMPFDPTPGSSRGEARESALERARRREDGDVDIPGSRPTPTPGPTTTPDQTTESTPGQTTESSPGQTTGSPPGQTTGSPPDQTTESTPGQTTESPPDQTTESSPGQTTESSPGQTTESSPGQTTESSPGQTTEPPENTTRTTNATASQPGVTTTEPPTGGTTTNGGVGPPSPPGGSGTATGTPGSGDGGGISGVARDRVTILGGAAALALGAHHFGAVDRISRELWLREQEPTDSPRADAERAFARVEHLLERRYRERKRAETPRQYLDAIGVDDTRVRRLTAIYERAHYGDEVTREAATEAIQLADDVITGS